MIRSGDGTSHALIDGSVFAANPTLCALSAAMDLYPGASGYLILSLGTGRQTHPLHYAQAKNWASRLGAADQRCHLGCVVGDALDTQAAEMAGDTHFRFQVDLTGQPAALDDARLETLQRLEALARTAAAKESDRLTASWPSINGCRAIAGNRFRKAPG